MAEKKFALIVAGGTGSRMNSAVPKQFLELVGKPVLMRTIEQFAGYEKEMEFVVVLPSDYMAYWQELCVKYDFKIVHRLVAGGLTRFQSVRNGLDVIEGSGLVFIHDAVRPLVSKQTIHNCEETAKAYGNALPVLPLPDSLREVSREKSKHVDRSRFRLVQTPQTFSIALIKKAFLQPEQDLFTDDASVCEAMGETIRLVEGNRENIKITSPVDLLIAENLFIINNK